MNDLVAYGCYRLLHCLAYENVVAHASRRSGKGGVGKSTVCLHLALALQRLGVDVAVLDADIYGPSLPTLTGITQKPDIDAQKRFIPLIYENIPMMSLGWMISPSAAPVWRGPMLQKAITKMLMHTAWPASNILLVDMPPGTGDVPLTLQRLCQNSMHALAVSGRHPLALADVRRCLQMFTMLKIPCVGIVENMVSPLWEVSQKEQEEALGAHPVLGSIPLHKDMASIPMMKKPCTTSQLDFIAQKIRASILS